MDVGGAVLGLKRSQPLLLRLSFFISTLETITALSPKSPSLIIALRMEAHCSAHQLNEPNIRPQTSG
jgi:hypothetical protein